MKRSALPRRSPLRRYTRLRQQSAKRKALNHQRTAFVESVLSRRPTCEFPTKIEMGLWVGVHFVPCGEKATDVHEPLTRARGGSVLDEDNAVPLCRSHHDHVHHWPEWSQGVGLLRPSWSRQAV